MFAPLEMMIARVNRNGTESDTVLFHELMYLGEFIAKLTTAGFVAAIQDDRELHRYRIIHHLVRADGIGEWATRLDEALTGTVVHHLSEPAKSDRRIFIDRSARGSWQHDCVIELRAALAIFVDGENFPADTVTLRDWFSSFAELRNKTRGHGAVTPAKCAKAAPLLDRSVRRLAQNNPIFTWPWAYLHRSMSGKYRVVPVGGDGTEFAPLKTVAAISGENYPDGLYIRFDQPRRVELVETDLDVADFFVPNGAFTAKRFELHSPITDSRRPGNSAPYLANAGERPTSETQARGELVLIGKVFTNLPNSPSGYIARSVLEQEVRREIVSERHPIVTLVGRGGIGKTSLALKLVHDEVQSDRFSLILWFSSRDIDLSMAGPKLVQPGVLTERDIANEFRTLVGAQKTDKKDSAVQTMSEYMRNSPLGPILFVFDNFETVRSPQDVFNWIDTNIRYPNKVLITTRFRDFKADYPINVSGMEEAEARLLVKVTAHGLGIESLINPAYSDQIIEESNGHPYVIKIMLGEVADIKTRGRPKQLLARKEEILDALFERTFANLSPVAAHIFLVLSSWRSLVPQLALEAVTLQRSTEGADPEAGVDELLRMSLIERITAADGNDFIDVPLTASLFGLRKLLVSPRRALVESDVKLLKYIGPTAVTGLKEGIRPRLNSLFSKISRRIESKETTLESMRPLLEFVARGFPPAWLWLADMEEQLGSSSTVQVSEYIRRFLDKEPDSAQSHSAWIRLFRLYQYSRDILGACGAFLKAAEIIPPPVTQISGIAQLLNSERDLIERMDLEERGAVFGPLATLFELGLDQCSATDLSRLAWLHLHAGHSQRALEIAQLGLNRDPYNQHCSRLLERLEV